MISYRALIIIVCTIAAFYASFYAAGTPPLERRAHPYAAENPSTEKRRHFYVITDEKGQTELMRIPLAVSIGDEVLASDNKLYRVTRIEGGHAYAAYIRQVKL